MSRIFYILKCVVMAVLTLMAWSSAGDISRLNQLRENYFKLEFNALYHKRQIHDNRFIEETSMHCCKEIHPQTDPDILNEIKYPYKRSATIFMLCHFLELLFTEDKVPTAGDYVTAALFILFMILLVMASVLLACNNVTLVSMSDEDTEKVKVQQVKGGTSKVAPAHSDQSKTPKLSISKSTSADNQTGNIRTRKGKATLKIYELLSLVWPNSKGKRLSKSPCVKVAVICSSEIIGGKWRSGGEDAVNCQTKQEEAKSSRLWISVFGTKESIEQKALSTENALVCKMEEGSLTGGEETVTRPREMIDVGLPREGQTATSSRETMEASLPGGEDTATRPRKIKEARLPGGGETATSPRETMEATLPGGEKKVNLPPPSYNDVISSKGYFWISEEVNI